MLTSPCKTNCSSPGELDEIGIDYIEGGYPLSNPKDAEYFQAGEGHCS